MAENKSQTLPKFNSLDQLVQFFDSNDMGEYWDQMPKVQADINLRCKTHLVAIDQQLIPMLAEIAKAKNISFEELINSWLKEKLRSLGRS